MGDLQAVNHPYLVVHSTSASGLPEEDGLINRVAQHSGACAVCHDPLEDGVAAKCGDCFCRACLQGFLETNGGHPLCPACNKALTIELSPASQVCIVFLLQITFALASLVLNALATGIRKANLRR